MKEVLKPFFKKVAEVAVSAKIDMELELKWDERDGKVSDMAETTGASKLNRTDMFYADGSPIPMADLEHIDEVTMRNLVYVPMEQGDVVLVDNYQVMHGRDVFEG